MGRKYLVGFLVSDSVFRVLGSEQISDVIGQQPPLILSVITRRTHGCKKAIAGQRCSFLCEGITEVTPLLGSVFPSLAGTVSVNRGIRGQLDFARFDTGQDAL